MPRDTRVSMLAPRWRARWRALRWNSQPKTHSTTVVSAACAISPGAPPAPLIPSSSTGALRSADSSARRRAAATSRCWRATGLSARARGARRSMPYPRLRTASSIAPVSGPASGASATRARESARFTEAWRTPGCFLSASSTLEEQLAQCMPSMSKSITAVDWRSGAVIPSLCRPLCLRGGCCRESSTHPGWG